ncbi:MAG TPA: LLM class flavin-dependent oxidoreductase [Thermomicrobiales bacterium]|nr:LLM class flavin-dependent oxidoreductase [Thermomicrobiales bacterium]
MGYRAVVTYHVEEHGGREAPAVFAEIFEQVALADALGFEALWLAEHHFGVHQSFAAQPLMLALAAALRTRRLAVGTSLIVLPLHHPLAVAEQLATLDALTGGRLSVGFGSGSAPAEFAGFGLDLTPEERYGHFREALEVLELAWGGEPFRYDGAFYRVPETRLTPRPSRPLREVAWLGAMSSPTAALAGALGYGLQLPRGRTPADYAPVLDAYRAARREHGHPACAERVAIARCVYVGADDAAALSEAAPSVAAFYRQSKRLAPDAPVPPASAMIEELRFVVGGPERCAREIAALGAATGMTHLSVQPTWQGLDFALATASLRRFGESVLPAVGRRP